MRNKAAKKLKLRDVMRGINLNYQCDLTYAAIDQIASEFYERPPHELAVKIVARKYGLKDSSVRRELAKYKKNF